MSYGWKTERKEERILDSKAYNGFPDIVGTL